MKLLALWFLLIITLTVSSTGQSLAEDTPVRSFPLESYLRDKLGVEFTGTSPYLVVELSGGEVALFRSEEDEPWGSQAEVAGYRMSQWLGLDGLVPETVTRRLGKADVPEGCWPYPQDSRLGSLQTFLPARPISDDELAALDKERVAQIELLSFLMGRYDNHTGNTLIQSDGTVVIVDFENALEPQMVRYGEYPYVQRGRPNDQQPSVAADQPFPFDDPQVLVRPTVAELRDHMAPFRAAWSGAVEPLHKMVSNSLDHSLRSIVWNHRQWLQVKVRSRHPSCTKFYPPALMDRLAQLTIEDLEGEILLPPFTRQHALAILERRDQILRAAGK